MSNHQSATRPDTPAGRLRVLLVDDNREILDLAAAALAACTIVGVVMNSCEALAAVESLKPDVVVLDISMPGMTGFDVAQQLRAASWIPAIVFLSVYEDEALIRTAYAHGGVGYVVKSRLTSELPPAVRAATAASR